MRSMLPDLEEGMEGREGHGMGGEHGSKSSGTVLILKLSSVLHTYVSHDTETISMILVAEARRI